MLKGKTAVVTGGSRGIGAAIVCKLASMGANAAVIYAGNAAAAENVCEKCRQEYGVQAKAYQCNVADFSATKETVAKIKADFGTAQILVNNAGITRDGLLAMMKEEDFDAVLSTNLKGAFNMIRHMTGLFLRAREGCIINIASVSGMMGNAGQCNYSADEVCGEGACIQRHPLQRDRARVYRNGYDGKSEGQSSAPYDSPQQDGRTGGCGGRGSLSDICKICDRRSPPR